MVDDEVEQLWRDGGRHRGLTVGGPLSARTPSVEMSISAGGVEFYPGQNFSVSAPMCC